MAVNPRGSDLKAFIAKAPDDPVVMLNLLRFREGGAATYDAYVAHFRPHAERHGAEVLHFGRGDDPLVAEDGQAWDALLVVRYPTRRAFGAMVADPDYQDGTHLRTEALVEAVLQPMVPVDLDR